MTIPRLTTILCALALVSASSGCLMMKENEVRNAPSNPALKTPSLSQSEALLNFGNPPEGLSAVARAETGEYAVIRVFYGTNRKPSGKKIPNEFYTHDRDELRYGFCEVSVPERHTEGEVERPSIWKFEFREDPRKHVVLQSVQEVDRRNFLGSLAADVDQASQREAFVFIHGYNVSFAEAAYRTAQMAADLKFDGPPIMYSWPSAGELVGYVADLAAADASKADLQHFMEDVARESGATRIHLIAHSMGNRLLTGALSQLADDACERDVPKFNEVILAAPDVDADVFRREIAPKILNTADRLTIYASNKDIALEASEEVHRAPRLGQAGHKLTTFPSMVGIDVVDASHVDFSLFTLGHSTYSGELLNDIRLVLGGSRPGERGLLPYQTGGAWVVQSTSPLEPIEHGYIIQAKATTTSFWQRSRAVFMSKIVTLGGSR